MQLLFFLKISVYDYCNNQSVLKQVTINEGKETFSSSFPWLGAFCINLISLIPTQSAPLTHVSFVIYAKLSWQLASRGVARVRPCRPFQFSLEEGAPPATWESLRAKTSASTLGCCGDDSRDSSPLKLVEEFCHTHGCLEGKGRQGGLTGKVGRNNV